MLLAALLATTGHIECMEGEAGHPPSNPAQRTGPRRVREKIQCEFCPPSHPPIVKGAPMLQHLRNRHPAAHFGLPIHPAFRDVLQVIPKPTLPAAPEEAGGPGPAISADPIGPTPGGSSLQSLPEFARSKRRGADHRARYTHAYKADALTRMEDFVEECGGSAYGSCTAAARSIGVCRTLLAKWSKDRERILELAAGSYTRNLKAKVSAH